MRFILLSIMLYITLPAHAQQKCELPDSTYWVCADSGSLLHVGLDTIKIQIATKESRLTAVLFSKHNRQKGWAAGIDAKANNPILMQTKDGGKSWSYVLLPPAMKGEEPEYLAEAKPGNLFIVMKSGLVLKSNDGGLNFIRTPRPKDPAYGKVVKQKALQSLGEKKK